MEVKSNSCKTNTTTRERRRISNCRTFKSYATTTASSCKCWKLTPLKSCKIYQRTSSKLRLTVTISRQPVAILMLLKLLRWNRFTMSIVTKLKVFRMKLNRRMLISKPNLKSLTKRVLSSLTLWRHSMSLKESALKAVLLKRKSAPLSVWTLRLKSMKTRCAKRRTTLKTTSLCSRKTLTKSLEKRSSNRT